MEDGRRWLRILVPAILVGTAALLMVAGPGAPQRIVFDEVYYVNDARDMLEFGVEQGFVVHPQLGKMLIAASIWLFGDTPFGWRALGGLAGAGTVLLTYLIGLRLFRRVTPAAFAALLVAIDGVFLVQARTAMLDVFLAFFVALGAWALVAHLQRTRASDEAWLADDPGPHDRLPGRDPTLLVLAGVAFGLAIGVKWSGLLGLGSAGLVAIGAELARRRRVLGSPWRRPWRGIGLLAATLVLVPTATYLVTWTPWFVDYTNSYEAEQTCEEPRSSACAATPLPGKAAGLWRFHGRMVRFHDGLEAEHSYRAPAYAWPLLARPVVFYYETCSEDRLNRVPDTETEDGEVTVEVPEPCVVERDEAAEMLAVGNPALWWGFLPALALLVGGLVRRDRRAAVPLTFVLGQFVPWLVVSRPVFSFYAVPLVPFLALGLAAAVVRLGDRRPVLAPLLGAVAGGGLGVGAVAIWDATGGSPTRPVYGLVAAGAAALGAAVVRLGDRRPVLAPLLGAVAGGGIGAAAVAIWDAAGGSPTRAVYGLVAAGAAALGTAVATWLFTRPDDPVDVPGWSRPATWVLGILVVAAVGLALFFLPIWLGIPLDTDLVRARWWFRGWI